MLGKKALEGIAAYKYKAYVGSLSLSLYLYTVRWWLCAHAVSVY